MQWILFPGRQLVFESNRDNGGEAKQKGMDLKQNQMLYISQRERSKIVLLFPYSSQRFIIAVVVILFVGDIYGHGVKILDGVPLFIFLFTRFSFVYLQLLFFSLSVPSLTFSLFVFFKVDNLGIFPLFQHRFCAIKRREGGGGGRRC